MTKIAITGAGIVSAIGVGKSDTLAALRSVASGIGPRHYLHSTHDEFPLGEVKLSDSEMKQRLGITAEPTTRTALMGMLAMDEALDQARLLHGSDVERVALISGTTVGGMDKSERFYLDFLAGDSRNAYIDTHDCGATTQMIADRYGFFTLATSISTACSSAANAFVLGANLLRAGMADIAVVGGSECLSKFHLNGFNSLMILDREPCRPFDASRAGLNLGEGAAYLVLETEETALRRGATPLATLSGYGNACDAFHQTATSPEGNGAYLAMSKALKMARLKPADIDYVNAHGTATPNNDATESQALIRLFGKELPPVSSTKGMTGHTTSASGSVEVTICLLALQEQLVPVNCGFGGNAMPDGIRPATDPVPPRKLRHVMCNSFGFGGNDTSLIISKL